MFMSGIISSQILTLEPMSFIGYGTRISEMSHKDHTILLHEYSVLLDDIVIYTPKVQEKRENVTYQIQSINTSLQYKSYPLLTLTDKMYALDVWYNGKPSNPYFTLCKFIEELNNKL